MIQESTSTRLYRLIFGLLGFVAVFYQFYSRSQIDPFNPLNFFSYFTILSNILIFTLFLISSLTGTASTSFDVWRGGAVVYMMITGLIYFALLRGLEESLQTPIPWVNTVLHYIMPLAALIDWTLDRPTVRLSWSILWKWLIFPTVYLLYSLTRGSITGFYPYPFLDVAANGLVHVLMTSAIIVVVFVLVSTFVRWIGNKRHTQF